MKNNAILRIIIWSIVIVLLLGILAGALGYNRYRHNRRNRISEVATAPSSLSTQEIQNDGSGVTNLPDTIQYDANEIRSLNIQWAAGTITIQTDPNADSIQITENTRENNKYQTVYKRSGDRLTIQFSKDTIAEFGFSIGDNLEKDLTVLVPENWQCEELEIDAASANLKIQNLTILDVEFDGASGVCDFQNCNIGSLDIDTASGDIHFTGSLNKLDFDAASASFYGKLTNTPYSIDMDSMSGDLELTLPEDTGFTVSLDGLSTSFSSEFEASTYNKKHIYGDGRCQINVDAMSGDVTILKK